jgi:hypothetical protein
MGPITRRISGSCASIRSTPWSTARSAIPGAAARLTSPTRPPRSGPNSSCEAGTYIDFTWALVLNGLPGHRTRLLVRTRANYSPRALRYLTLPLGLFDATYGMAQLRAIARRAENPQLGGT